LKQNEKTFSRSSVGSFSRFDILRLDFMVFKVRFLDLLARSGTSGHIFKSASSDTSLRGLPGFRFYKQVSVGILMMERWNNARYTKTLRDSMAAFVLSRFLFPGIRIGVRVMIIELDLREQDRNTFRENEGKKLSASLNASISLAPHF
jgi:hypothetical protein